MADKATKKSVAITLKRTRPYEPIVVVATGFKLRIEKSGLVEVLLEVGGQSRRAYLNL